jgi:RNA polymerase sigma-70 factor (ECF subfamily)
VPSEPSTTTDAELAGQTQAGSLSAFEELVYRYEHRVYAFVSQFCRNATDAREITQDTFVKALQSIAQFDTRREFAPWLFTIARHKWIDRQRAAPPLADTPPPEIAEEIHPGELLAQEEDRQQLWRLARACLTENQFQALWLYYAEDMAVPHVARVLGKTRVHVKVLLFRARQTLGRHLNSARTLSEAIPAAKPQPTPLNRSLMRQFAGGKIPSAKIP